MDCVLLLKKDINKFKRVALKIHVLPFNSFSKPTNSRMGKGKGGIQKTFVYFSPGNPIISVVGQQNSTLSVDILKKSKKFFSFETFIQ